MSKSAVVAIVLAVVVLGGGGALLVAHNNSNDKTNSGTDMSNMDTNKDSGDSAKAATNSVTIENFAFSPSSITVKKGTAVTWANKDGATHTVTSTSGPKNFDSGDLADGKSFSFTFDTVGTYEYHCSIHSNMTGTVTVTE